MTRRVARKKRLCSKAIPNASLFYIFCSCLCVSYPVLASINERVQGHSRAFSVSKVYGLPEEFLSCTSNKIGYGSSTSFVEILNQLQCDWYNQFVLVKSQQKLEGHPNVFPKSSLMQSFALILCVAASISYSLLVILFGIGTMITVYPFSMLSCVPLAFVMLTCLDIKDPVNNPQSVDSMKPHTQKKVTATYSNYPLIANLSVCPRGSSIPPSYTNLQRQTESSSHDCRHNSQTVIACLFLPQSVISAMLLVAGDVETNPGPNGSSSGDHTEARVTALTTPIKETAKAKLEQSRMVLSVTPQVMMEQMLFDEEQRTFKCDPRKFFCDANECFREGTEFIIDGLHVCPLCGMGYRSDKSIVNSHIIPNCVLQTFKNVHGVPGSEYIIYDFSTGNVLPTKVLTHKILCFDCEQKASSFEDRLNDQYIFIVAEPNHSSFLYRDNNDNLWYILANIVFRGLLVNVKLTGELFEDQDFEVVFFKLWRYCNPLLRSQSPPRPDLKLFLLRNQSINESLARFMYPLDFLVRMPHFTELIDDDDGSYLYTKFDCFHVVLPISSTVFDKYNNGLTMKPGDNFNKLQWANLPLINPKLIKPNHYKNEPPSVRGISLTYTKNDLPNTFPIELLKWNSCLYPRFVPLMYNNAKVKPHHIILCVHYFNHMTPIEDTSASPLEVDIIESEGMDLPIQATQSAGEIIVQFTKSVTRNEQIANAAKISPIKFVVEKNIIFQVVKFWKKKCEQIQDKPATLNITYRIMLVEVRQALKDHQSGAQAVHGIISTIEDLKKVFHQEQAKMLSELEKQIKQDKDQYQKSLEEELKQCKKEIGVLLQREKDKNEEVARLKEILAEKRTEAHMQQTNKKQELQQKLDKAETEIDRLKLEQQQLQKQHKSEVKALQVENDKLREQVDKQKDELHKIASEKEGIYKKVTDYERQNEELKEQIRIREEDLESLRNEIAIKEKEVHEKEDELKHLTDRSKPQRKPQYHHHRSKSISGPLGI